MKKLITTFIILIFLISCGNEVHITDKVIITKQELVENRFKRHHKAIYMYTIKEDKHLGKIFIFSDNVYKVGDTIILKP